MKSKLKWCVLFLAFVAQATNAQVSLDSLLRKVSENNTTLQAANRLYEAEVIASKVGNSPPNPEVEYGYLWGSPDQLGTRTDFAVTQSFDFPTAYTSQSKLVKISTEQAELRLMAARQEILLNARKAWIEAVFLNIKKSMLEDRLVEAEKVHEGFKYKYEAGEANQMEMNQAYMKKSLLNNELERTKIARQNIQYMLDQLAGGSEVDIPEKELPDAGELVFDTLMADYKLGPANRWYETEVEKKDQEKDVVFNKKLPRLMAGYYSEYVLNTKFRGIKAGVSIPLWGDARAVNSAKASRAFAESDAWRFRSEQDAKITSMYYEWASLKSQVDELDTILASTDTESLLIYAVEEGEISLTEYFYESDFFFQSKLSLLESYRDLLLLEADLTKIYY